MERPPCVYLLASHCNGTLYVGVTSHLIKRIYEHRNGLVDSFTKRFAVHTLVWYEIHECLESAILREKPIKKWTRKAKIGLIEQHNPTWQDLWPELTSPSLDSGFRHKSAGSGFGRAQRGAQPESHGCDEQSLPE